MITKQERKDLHTNTKRVSVRSNMANVESNRNNTTQIIKDHSNNKFYQRTVVHGDVLYNEVKTTKE